MALKEMALALLSLLFTIPCRPHFWCICFFPFLSFLFHFFSLSIWYYTTTKSHLSTLPPRFLSFLSFLPYPLLEPPLTPQGLE
jgi:hypothetical protein